MTGWASFNIYGYPIPEPSAWAISLFVSAMVLIRRPRRPDSFSTVVPDGNQRVTKTSFSHQT